MKVIKFFIKWIIVVVLGLTATVGVMFYLSSSGERRARETCDAIKRGEFFDNREMFGRKAFLVEKIDNLHFSYLFLMNFDGSARCNIFIDKNNVVIRAVVDIK